MPYRSSGREDPEALVESDAPGDLAAQAQRSEPAELLLVIEPNAPAGSIVGRAVLWDWDKHAVVCAGQLELPAPRRLAGEAGQLTEERRLAEAFDAAEIAALAALRDTRAP